MRSRRPSRSRSRWSSPQPESVRRHTPNLPAYESLLKARHFLRKATPDSLTRCKECLEQAIALDPDYALAHADLALYFAQLAAMGHVPARQALPRARSAAHQALRIDQLCRRPTPTWPRGAVSRLRLARGRASIPVGDGHGPVPPEVSHFYGYFYLLPLGHIREATAELQRALKQDPLNLYFRTQLGICYSTAGKKEEASRQFRQTLELDENFWFALLGYSMWHALEGSVEQLLAWPSGRSGIAPTESDSIGRWPERRRDR